MDISEAHKKSKKRSYWGDLSEGSTTEYKARKIEELIRNFFPLGCSSILDIGSGGNCDHILKYKRLLGAGKIACLDYDEEVINKMKQQFPNQGIEWHVADIFQLQNFKEGFDLIFLLDVLHEVYSFYGRLSRDRNEPINDERGLEHVIKAITNISRIVNPGGGIIITDNILPENDVPVTLKLKTAEISKAVDYFLKNYPSRKFGEISRKGDSLTLNSKDLSVLLTQYNKIKKKDWDRWAVERLEQHQYMTERQYMEMFARLGFRTNMIIETPDYVREEWDKDFEITGGLKNFPPKRVTLLSIKERQY
jgi:SAM-dependent methyltransferase